MDFGQVTQSLTNGVVFGAILSLCAIGLTLVYGILNLSNFAHGDFLSLGAFAALLFTGQLFGALDVSLVGVGVVLAGAVLFDTLVTHRLSMGERLAAGSAGGVSLLLGVALFLGVGVKGSEATTLILVGGTVLAAFSTVASLLAFEFVVWRRLRNRRATSLTLIIVSIGVALVVRNLLLMKFGGGIQSFDRPGEVSPQYFGVRVSDGELATLVIAAVLIVLVHLFLKLTRAGKAMRALADNADLARISGVNVDRMVVYVWIIAGILLAVAGVMLSLVRNNAMDPQMGAGLLIPMFAAVIVGGIGSAYGAMLGGLLIGVAMKTTFLWIGSEYELAAAFVALILVLIFRPQGLLGVKS